MKQYSQSTCKQIRGRRLVVASAYVLSIAVPLCQYSKLAVAEEISPSHAGQDINTIDVLEMPKSLHSLEALEGKFGTHCFDCHGYGGEEGGLNFEKLAEGGYGDKTQARWEAIWQNLRAETMPPADADHPELEQRAEWIKWINSDVFKLDPHKVDPGKVIVRRLNRSEYAQTIREITNVQFDVDEEFPADDTGYGFDTIGEVLMLSPILLEKYLAAAETIINQAVPLEGPQLPRVSARKEDWKVGAVDGEKGYSASFEHAVDFYRREQLVVGKSYEMHVRWQLENAWTRTPTAGELMLTLVDGGAADQSSVSTSLEYKEDSSGGLQINFVATSAQADFCLAFKPLVNDPNAYQTEHGKVPYYLKVDRSELIGPLDSTRSEYPHSKRKLLFNGPPPADSDNKLEHAKAVIKKFADEAYRRPVDDASVQRLVDYVGQSMQSQGQSYEVAVAGALKRVLISPRFLYRIELPKTDDGKLASTINQNNLLVGLRESSELTPIYDSNLIDDYSLASRLSYFLWGGPPDDRLYYLASQGQLHQKIDEEIDRMIGQQWRLRQGVSNFVGQWLQTRDVHANNFEVAQIVGGYRKAKMIDFEYQQRQAMLQETEMLFRYLIEEDRPVTELLNARYTFLNEKLAKFYGIEGIEGDEMRRVELSPESHRVGVLTHGSFLMVTSNPTRTSPVKRGLFILENLLGTPSPPAPPNVPALEDAKKGDLSSASLRQVLEQHRRDPACASCHSRMDPLGLALENYNAIGQWRQTEPAAWSWGKDENRDGSAIDPRGILMTGESFESVEELADILATKRKDDFYRCLTEKMMIFALGRGLTYEDSLVIQDIVSQLQADDGKMRTLIKSICTSIPFTRMQVNKERLTMQ